jgi:hypothetical protein
MSFFLPWLLLIDMPGEGVGSHSGRVGRVSETHHQAPSASRWVSKTRPTLRQTTAWRRAEEEE